MDERSATHATAPARASSESEEAPPRTALEDGLHSELHSDIGILAVLSQFAVMQVVLACTALIRNKVIAFRLGPMGFGEITQIAAVVSVVTTVVSFGMGVALSRNAAACRSVEERQAHLANANAMVLGLAVVAVSATLALLASGRLLSLAGLRETPQLVFTAALFCISIPVEGLRNNYLALLQGIIDVRGLAVRRSLAVLVATGLAVPLVWFFGFIGAAIQFFVLTAFVAATLGWRCRSLGYAPLRLQFDRRTAALLASFGVLSVASGFAQGFADTAVRTRLIESASATANGLLQAASVLSGTVKQVVLASVGSLSLATIAQKTSRPEVSAAVGRLLNVVIPVAASALGLLGLLGGPSLALLYSGAFSPAATLFPYLLTADLVLVFIWVVGAPLLAYGDRILWVVLDLVYAAARWSIAVLLIADWGSRAVVVGYLAAVVLHLALNLAVYRFRYRLELPAVHSRRLATAVALVGGLSAVGAIEGGHLAVTLMASVIWLLYVAHHARRTGLVDALKQRFVAR